MFNDVIVYSEECKSMK